VTQLHPEVANARRFVNSFSLASSAICGPNLLFRLKEKRIYHHKRISVPIQCRPHSHKFLSTSSKLTPSDKNFQRKFHKPHTDTLFQYDNASNTSIALLREGDGYWRTMAGFTAEFCIEEKREVRVNMRFSN
jgi:hypothetical protein